MATEKITGEDVVETSYAYESSDREACVIEVQGLYSKVKAEDPENYCPSGYCVETSSCTTTGDGLGKLTVRCVKYNTGASFSAERTTIRVDMLEVTYDLEDHPHLDGCRDMLLKWLATDEAKRVDGNTYKYADNSGALVVISDATAIKFCKAYMAGIKTFNRYYPVIERIGIWKNPPGLSRSDRSFTSGSPTFSSNVGKYDTPPITLNGFPATNYFKSKDSWVQNADTTWTRTEQWTYTPESSSSTHAWIYTNL